jgi:hypothetical protein
VSVDNTILYLDDDAPPEDETEQQPERKREPKATAKKSAPTRCPNEVVVEQATAV